MPIYHLYDINDAKTFGYLLLIVLSCLLNFNSYISYVPANLNINKSFLINLKLTHGPIYASPRLKIS